jgi:PAS domain S-box-containing protein
MTSHSELRILLVEDMPEDAELIQRALRKADIPFVAKRVDMEAQFIQELQAFRPDIVLSDFRLRDFNGRAALDIVRQRYRTVPMVMVTGALGDEEAVELIKAGARDYVLKDRLARLGPAIRRAIAEEQALRHREAAEQALRASELRYRRLFEAAYDGILVIDCLSRKIIDSNLVIEALLGYARDELLGKELQEVGVLADVDAYQRLFSSLRQQGYVRYEHQHLRNKGGRDVEVEFVSNLYQVGERTVFQCNIRDLSNRRMWERREIGKD